MCDGEFVAPMISLGCLALVVVVVEKQIVRRRELVVRLGRQIQNLFHMPYCISVFADADPGMLDKDFRFGVYLLLCSSFSVGLGLLIALTKGSMLDPWALSFVFPIPLSLTTINWLTLLHAKRRLLRQLTPERPLSGYEGGEKKHPSIVIERGEGDRGPKEMLLNMPVRAGPS